MACVVWEVAPPGMTFAEDVGGGLSLPHGSLVRADGACAGGTAVTVMSIPAWFSQAVDVPPLGATACVPVADLVAPPPDFLVQVDVGAWHAGDVVRSASCDPTTLAALRPMTPEMLANARAVQTAYVARFGALPLQDVPVDDWGWVGLPLPETVDEKTLADTLSREHLDTPTRAEKALRWFGGDVDGKPTYAHFAGPDRPFVDIWGPVSTVVDVLDVSKQWAAYCPTVATNPASCLLQLGDLAWFSPMRPDPLGHVDQHGSCVDIRLFRNDASRYEALWNKPDDRPGVTGGYDQALQTAFLTWVTTHFPVTDAFFDDPYVLSHVKGVLAVHGHDDHAHLCFKP